MQLGPPKKKRLLDLFCGAAGDCSTLTANAVARCDGAGIQPCRGATNCGEEVNIRPTGPRTAMQGQMEKKIGCKRCRAMGGGDVLRVGNLVKKRYDDPFLFLEACAVCRVAARLSTHLFLPSRAEARHAG